MGQEQEVLTRCVSPPWTSAIVARTKDVWSMDTFVGRVDQDYKLELDQFIWYISKRGRNGSYRTSSFLTWPYKPRHSQESPEKLTYEYSNIFSEIIPSKRNFVFRKRSFSVFNFKVFSTGLFDFSLFLEPPQIWVLFLFHSTRVSCSIIPYLNISRTQSWHSLVHFSISVTVQRFTTASHPGMNVIDPGF